MFEVTSKGGVGGKGIQGGGRGSGGGQYKGPNPPNVGVFALLPLLKSPEALLVGAILQGSCTLMFTSS